MIPKCFPGDLAIVVTAHNKVNIGTILKVISLHPNQFEISAPEGDTLWTCIAPHQMVYDHGGKKRKRKKGPVPDSYLHPIRGEPVGQDIAMLVVINELRRSQAASEACLGSDAHL